jgi:phosphatidylinositol glycan class Z
MALATTELFIAAIIQIIIVSLTVLSMQPHQEPRFLVPLLLPIIVLVANTGQLACLGKAFWVR